MIDGNETMKHIEFSMEKHIFCYFESNFKTFISITIFFTVIAFQKSEKILRWIFIEYSILSYNGRINYLKRLSIKYSEMKFCFEHKRCKLN